MKASRFGPLILLPAFVALVILLVLARPAAAQSSWSGSGSLAFTSTPGPCSGSGTSQLDLSGDPSDVTGTITVDISSVNGACVGDFATGPVIASVSGYISGSDLYLTDSYGNTYNGTFSGGDLGLSFTTYSPPSDGATCFEFCTTVYTMQLSGSGDLAPVGGGGSPSPDLSSPSTAVAAVGLILGAAGVGLAVSSLPGRIPPPPPAAGGGAGVTRPVPSGSAGGVSGNDGTSPQYAPAPEPDTGEPPAPFISGGGAGEQPITGAGPSVGPPDLVPPPSEICSFISVNGVPLNPNYRDLAEVRFNPLSGRWQYWDQHTGEWFHAFPQGA
jgi:hypothetical protein